ncbi:hypothetical protein BsWGS_08167 [Bradybaena similaris]
MENCTHVENLVVSTDESILDPSRWQCSVCGTTEWVWACLTCANFACGRLNEQHAVQHFETTQHPLAIEINEKYVYCYICDEYVIKDNAQGDIESLRSALIDIGTLSLEEVQHKGGKLLRSYSCQQEVSRSQADEDDRLVTATCHYRKSLLGKTFSAWQEFVQREREMKAATSTSAAPHPTMMTRSRSSLFHVKKRTLIPGVTGLRNLGNTCYINSIIQALGHLEEFREYFCQLVFGLFSPTATPLPDSSPSSIFPGTAKHLLRFNTVDYFQHLSNQQSLLTGSSSSSKKWMGGQKKSGGLHGGDSADATEDQGLPDVKVAVVDPLLKVKTDAMKTLSLCQELHGLIRVLWSGKWAQVSPHGFLHAVWKAIPMFKGHSQHDAQEFLCELLDKVSQEIENLPQCKGMENIVDQSFRGEIVSQVTCSACSNISSRREPFLDLSLEFPRSFQYTNSQFRCNMCHLTEMLSTFTDIEDLEPQSYICDKCNNTHKRSSRQREIKTDAKKQLLISKPPEILRLHLKRFRWCGRNHREKIGTHVAFDEEFDISPFCQTVPTVPRYRLHSVVVHHGAGFRSGHYTTYTYNIHAASWLHCNDSRVQLVSLEEVLASQAYILFYTRELTPVSLDDMPELTKIASGTDTLSTISTIPDFDQETMETLKRLSQGETEQAVDDEVSISFHRDPTLVKKLSTISSHSGQGLKRTSTLSNTEQLSPSKLIKTKNDPL